MKKIIPSDKIYISNSEMPNAGRGVFAKTDIKSGEVVETCPYIEIPIYDPELFGSDYLMNYYYFFGVQKERMLIALGSGSIYNHSYTPNTVYKIIEDEESIQFIAKSDIKKDQEILVNYNQESPGSDPLWFEVD